MPAPRPGLGVGVDHERVDLPLVRLRVQHRQRAVGATERQVGHRLDSVVEPLPRRDRERRQAVGVVRPDLATVLLEAALAGEEADDLVLRLGRGRHQREPRRCVARTHARHAGDGAAGHRAGHVEGEQQPLARALDVAERRVERAVEHVDDLAYRVPLAAATEAAAGRVGAERRQHGDRVHLRAADPLRITELRNGLRGAVRARCEHADARHRRQVADQRGHRHLGEQRLPDLGRGQVLRLERLARQPVLAHERRRHPWRRRLLGAGEPLDQARQAVGLAASDDPLEQASVLIRDVELRVAGTDLARRVSEAEQVAVRDTCPLAVLDRLVGEREQAANRGLHRADDLSLRRERDQSE
jgi:hypothetical protein